MSDLRNSLPDGDEDENVVRCVLELSPLDAANIVADLYDADDDDDEVKQDQTRKEADNRGTGE